MQRLKEKRSARRRQSTRLLEEARLALDDTDIGGLCSVIDRLQVNNEELLKLNAELEQSIPDEEFAAEINEVIKSHKKFRYAVSTRFPERYTQEHDKVNNDDAPTQHARRQAEAREFRAARNDGKSPRAPGAGQGIHVARKQERKKETWSKNKRRDSGLRQKGGDNTSLRNATGCALFLSEPRVVDGAPRAQQSTRPRVDDRREVKANTVARTGDNVCFAAFPRPRTETRAKPRFHRGNKENARSETKSRKGLREEEEGERLGDSPF
ncbi:hypothetical protein MTO96_043554 [Rhipicephalus appendiculatus]